MSSPDATTSQMCAFHSHLRASFVCSLCYKPICTLCAFTRDNGTRICSECASHSSTGSHAGPRIVGAGDASSASIKGLFCVQHKNVSAVRLCKGCDAPMCATCDFPLPNGHHICPRCVVSPPRRMSSGRMIMLVITYVLAVYGTVGLGLVMSGVFAGMLRDRSARAMFEICFSLFLFVPTLVGAALGISLVDQRLRNPPSVWGAAIWNCLLVSVHLIFIVIGTFS
jgi:hypothetical protein